MPRPSLTAALARLAELRDERKRRARDRFRVVAGDGPDRFRAINELEADRLAIDEEIRQTKALVTRLMVERNAKPRAG